ncbi:type IV pilus modification protein PilV [Pseudomonas bijieensis]|jgi:type IV pilus assembly protein PilV|uniref:Type IV pilus modification protein PilV n=1 Tax=Pseudomonas bijieensis TaxID=2681983 RepID=A0A6N1CSN9_9PSED|nr:MULTISPECIES: type IV pilus modification protein PilV [Pseudomonas]AXP05336.1 type IV pilus modification protein PilV [Pseudomonas fluorescens]MCD9118930.1 type IV pilus modification protein PilV [Pseudomonas bijieensis]QIB06694.1 type IV pilus modification protein PilV [Pseudomonas fluorescens]QKS84583.1 type IV pilus modification protein PilV [Pseudomonas bijieensis]UQI30383.1 type IV pilus modification protein PilV [Pseudomonas bijieensis]
MKGCSKRAQAGMTLIEVLVAVLILGVGLLGAAMIQLNALKYTDSSRMTSQASFIAYDLLDRIRANSGADYTITPPSSPNLSVARDQDLYDFKTNIIAFGGATATGTIALNQRVYTITISWDDARAANTTNAAEARRSFVLTSRVAVDPVGATP